LCFLVVLLHFFFSCDTRLPVSLFFCHSALHGGDPPPSWMSLLFSLKCIAFLPGKFSCCFPNWLMAVCLSWSGLPLALGQQDYGKLHPFPPSPLTFRWALPLFFFNNSTSSLLVWGCKPFSPFDFEDPFAGPLWIMHTPPVVIVIQTAKTTYFPTVVSRMK